jgi:glycolate dehydrogenase iron-sulfur subunit
VAPPQPGRESQPLGAVLPEGTRFVGPAGSVIPNWSGPDHPAEDDLNACVACGLCLPHCPTYRLTGEESASPRGRIAAMRAVGDGRAEVDETFASFMDLCLSCRACEDVCPSHVPFGRMMEGARAQIEPLRSRRARLVRWLGFDVVLPRRWLLTAAASLAPVARPVLPRRIRSLVPPRAARARPLPGVTEPTDDVPTRGTVALLSGCVQDRWFRPVNAATIRVLARNGWRVVVPRRQTCCGALPAHYGHLGTARSLAATNLRAFARLDVRAVLVNAAGCGAHMKEYGDLLHGAGRAVETAARVRDLMEFLAETGIDDPPNGAGVARVAYHDACHALRAQGLATQPRAVLSRIPGLEIAEVQDGDRCCGAAGLYNVLQPAMSGELRRRTAEAVARAGAPVVASANPGCTMQIAAGLAELGADIEVVHPVELLDRAYRRGGTAGADGMAQGHRDGVRGG